MYNHCHMEPEDYHNFTLFSPIQECLKCLISALLSRTLGLVWLSWIGLSFAVVMPHHHMYSWIELHFADVIPHGHMCSWIGQSFAVVLPHGSHVQLDWTVLCCRNTSWITCAVDRTVLCCRNTSWITCAVDRTVLCCLNTSWITCVAGLDCPLLNNTSWSHAQAEILQRCADIKIIILFEGKKEAQIVWVD